MANLDADKCYHIITQNLQETLGGERIKAILDEGRHPKCYWGTAPTGRPHVGYFVPLTKIADFLRAGVEVTVLLADLHAFLDSKVALETIPYRTQYYKFVLLAVFKSLGIPTSKLLFVEGSSFQYSKEYSRDNFRLCAMVSIHDAQKAGAEVVKQSKSPDLAGLLYPGMQALDEEYLHCDFQFGGVDQRKIFTFAELYLPRLGYTKRAHLMNAMVPGLAGGKMSSSDPNSKIDLLDSPQLVKRKIKAAFCEEGNIEDNGILSFVQAVLIPISKLRFERTAAGSESVLEDGVGDQRPFVAEAAPEGTVFTINRPEKFGGPTHYSSFEDMKTDFAEKKLHPGDLKSSVEEAINRLLAPLRQMYDENEEWRRVTELAYPDPNAKPAGKKKEKKYTPPPPGKGKNLTKPTDIPTEESAVPATPAEDVS